MNAAAFDGPCWAMIAEIAHAASSARAAGILLGGDHIRVATVGDTHLIPTFSEIEQLETDVPPTACGNLALVPIAGEQYRIFMPQAGAEIIKADAASIAVMAKH